MRVLVCGGRDYLDYEHLKSVLEVLLPKEAEIIQGGAKGADFLAKVWAYGEDINCIEFPADWETYGRAAGHIRNKQMLEEGKPDLVVAFSGGAGTANMIKQAKAAGIKVEEV